MTLGALSGRRYQPAFYLFIAGWTFVLSLPAYRRSQSIAGDDWALLRSAGRIIAGASPLISPLHVYAVRSDVQVGPLALALDGMAQRWLGGNLTVLAIIALLAAASVGAIEALGAHGRELLVMGVALATVWATLGGWGHVEDALAVTAILCAAVTIRHDRALSAGVLVGVAIGCKPWALVAAPMLLGLTRHRARAVVAMAVVTLAPWAPFVIADSHTTDVTRYSWPIASGSALHALGFSGLTGAWLRPTQIGAGIVAAAAAAKRRWTAAPLAGVAVKVLLDPQVWPYYGIVPVAVALLVDIERRGRAPWWALSAAVTMFVAPAALPAVASGIVRVAWGVAVLILLVTVRRPFTPEPASRGQQRCLLDEGIVMSYLTNPDGSRPARFT